jgi:phasin
MAVARKSSAKSPKPVNADGHPSTDIIPTEALEAAAETILPAIEETIEETIEATIDKVEALQEHMDRTTEQSIEQSKRMFERLKVAAEETSSSVEASLTTVSKGVSEINLRALSALKVNADAQFAFIKALLETKTLSEAIALQSEHARTQFETIHAQARDIGELIQQVSTRSIEPIKSSLSRHLAFEA